MILAKTPSWLVLGTGEDDDFFSTVMGGTCLQQEKQLEHIDLQTPKEIAETELHRWERLTVEWAAFLREHQPDVVFDASDVWRNNPFVLVELVNILKWWNVNQRLYPAWRRIAQAAARRLARPIANSLQERVFSSLKRLDTH